MDAAGTPSASRRRRVLSYVAHLGARSHQDSCIRKVAEREQKILFNKAIPSDHTKKSACGGRVSSGACGCASALSGRRRRGGGGEISGKAREKATAVKKNTNRRTEVIKLQRVAQKPRENHGVDQRPDAALAAEKLGLPPANG